jgi:hypothetical protein
MIDKFLENEINNGKLQTAFESIAGNILIHDIATKGFVWDTKNEDATGQGNETVSEIPSGCCGIAGSFDMRQNTMSYPVNRRSYFISNSQIHEGGYHPRC